MSWTEKRIQEDNCGCKESPGKKRIRKKGFLFMGLGVILAGLVFLGTMQQGVNAEKLSPERPADGRYYLHYDTKVRGRNWLTVRA